MEKLNDRQYLIKKRGKYKIIYPIKKDMNKPFGRNNIHWKNFIMGSNFTLVLLVILLVSVSAWAYKHDIEMYQDVFEDPCNYCYDYQELNLSKDFETNMPNLTWEFKGSDTNGDDSEVT